MGLQPSASKTGLILLCQRPFDPAVTIDYDDDGPGEPARYGSAWHELMADVIIGKLPDNGARYDKAVTKAALDWNVERATTELTGHVRSSARYLKSWADKNGWDLSKAKVETSYAIDVASSNVREISAPTVEDHKYMGLNRWEIAGTIDLECPSVDGKKYLILDHKTGYMTEDHYDGTPFSEPAKLPQMKTVGLVGHNNDFEAIEVGIFHADRKGLPSIQTDRYWIDDRDEHRQELWKAFDKFGDGSLRPGKWCAHCPASSTCPARSADILGGASQALVAAAAEKLATANTNADKLSTEVRAARMYALIKKFEKLADIAKSEIRQLVRDGAVVELDDGATLEMSTIEVETLSKSSIVRALGRVAGDKLIESLRKKGVIEKDKRERMMPRKS